MNFIAIKPCFSISLAYYAIIFFSNNIHAAIYYTHGYNASCCDESWA